MLDDFLNDPFHDLFKRKTPTEATPAEARRYIFQDLWRLSQAVMNYAKLVGEQQARKAKT